MREQRLSVREPRPLKCAGVIVLMRGPNGNIKDPLIKAQGAQILFIFAINLL